MCEVFLFSLERFCILGRLVVFVSVWREIDLRCHELWARYELVGGRLGMLGLWFVL